MVKTVYPNSIIFKTVNMNLVIVVVEVQQNRLDMIQIKKKGLCNEFFQYGFTGRQREYH